MFKMLKQARQAKERAEESILRSEKNAEKLHESFDKNTEAHEDLMRHLDRRDRVRSA